jgi:low density lipoprotein receptor-related protein 5/6
MGKDSKEGLRFTGVGGIGYRITVKVFVACMTVLLASMSFATDKLYWTDSGTQKIQRSDIDGTNIEDVIDTGLSAPDGIAVDLAAGKVYWTDNTDGTINRANLNGTDPEIVVSGLITPVRIVLDVPNGKMYWTDVDNFRVQSANLDGTGVTDVLIGAGAPWGIDIDTTNQHLYFTERDADRIIRVDTDGNNAFTLTAVTPSVFGGIELLLSADSMYWTDRDLTGKRLSAATTIGTNLDVDRQLLSDLPDGIDIDDAQFTAYITTRNDPKIQSLALNGLGAPATLVDGTDGLDSPRDIVIVKNQGPTANVGPAVRIQEGADATFDASGSTDPENSPLYYNWDIDNDGEFDDATGVSPTVDWTTLTSLGLSNGTTLVRVEVSDGIDTDVATTALTIANDRLYWVDWATFLVQSSDLDGSVVSTVYDTGGESPRGIAFDADQRQIYWTNRFSSDSIQKADLDGANVETVVTFTDDAPYDLAVDSSAGKLYYTLTLAREIRRSDLDGANEEVLLAFGAGSSLGGIELDIADGKMYFADTTQGAVRRANLDGTGLQDITVGAQGPLGIGLDTTNRYVYWAEQSSGKIRRRGYDAAGPTGSAEDVITGLQQPRGLHFATAAGRLYWTDQTSKHIATASVSSPGTITTLVTGLLRPEGIIVLENTRPMANSGGAYTMNEGASIILDATGSTDTEGGTLTYAWDLDNDGNYDNATGGTPNIDWATLSGLGVLDGVNDIAVEVSDGFVTGTAATTLTIANLPPNANTGGPYAIDEGMSLVLDASGTTDPGGDSIGLYEWDLDGDLDYDEATGAQPTVPWSALKTLGLGNGTNTIRVRVTDEGNTTNLSDASSTLLTVTNLPPVTDVFERSITKIQVVDEPAPGFLAAVTDPGGDPISIVSWDTESVFGATVTVEQATGAFVYDPSSSTTLLRLSQFEEVVDSFTYTVQDSESGTKAQVTGTVNVIVSGDSGIPATGSLGRLLLMASLIAAGVAFLYRKRVLV